ncbi:uncharacterized protein LOC142420735 [Mycteria americana]|uniref:uncharacterized protein LOC142420735 n=1 Tax=Mycteria americana TaxID=33587 RepID=UPI003F58F0E8
MAAPPPCSGGAGGSEKRRGGPTPGSAPAAPRSQIMAAGSAPPPQASAPPDYNSQRPPRASPARLIARPAARHHGKCSLRGCPAGPPLPACPASRGAAGRDLTWRGGGKAGEALGARLALAQSGPARSGLRGLLGVGAAGGALPEPPSAGRARRGTSGPPLGFVGPLRGLLSAPACLHGAAGGLRPKVPRGLLALPGCVGARLPSPGRPLGLQLPALPAALPRAVSPPYSPGRLVHRQTGAWSGDYSSRRARRGRRVPRRRVAVSLQGDRATGRGGAALCQLAGCLPAYSSLPVLILRQELVPRQCSETCKNEAERYRHRDAEEEEEDVPAAAGPVWLAEGPVCLSLSLRQHRNPVPWDRVRLGQACTRRVLEDPASPGTTSPLVPEPRHPEKEIPSSRSFTGFSLKLGHV